MARDHRIIDNGQRVNYTCENYGFKTNTGKGEPHGEFSLAGGAVFNEPLINHEGYTLWLEHVIDQSNTYELYWLMWYDPNGIPTIPLSGVFDRNDLQQMLGRLGSFVP